MRRDYAVTFLAELVVLAAGLLTLRVAATYWAAPEFGAYLLARRTISFLYVPSLLGLGVSLPRWVALRVGSGDAGGPRAYLLAALVLVAGPLGLATAALLALPGSAADVLFGDARYRDLSPALLACLAGTAFHVLAYGWFRGHLQLIRANVLQVVNQAAVPLLPFLLPGLPPAQLLTVVGVAWIAVSAGTLGLALLGTRAGPSPPAGALRSRVRELAGYGIPRMPGDVALAALLSLPATLTAHLSGLEQAGYVSFGLAVLSMLGSGFAPIGVVLLPHATAMAARGQFNELRRAIRRLTAAGVALGALGVLAILALAHTVVVWYLGPQFEPAVPIVRLLAVGGLPYVLYVLLRTPIDALSVRALNARNLGVGLAAFLAGALLFQSVTGVAASLVGALCLTGVLTLVDTWRLLRDL